MYQVKLKNMYSKLSSKVQTTTNETTLPETNSSPLKIIHPKKETIVFQPSIFRGYVSFSDSEGTFFLMEFPQIWPSGLPPLEEGKSVQATRSQSQGTAMNACYFDHMHGSWWIERT